MYRKICIACVVVDITTTALIIMALITWILLKQLRAKLPISQTTQKIRLLSPSKYA